MSVVVSILSEAEVCATAPQAAEPGFGALTTEQGPLPLRDLDVRARLDGLLAHVTVRQTFVNPLPRPLEATYIFPLPDRAAVTGFRLEVAGRIVEGVLKERGEARADYDQAIASGRRAAIAEEERSAVFTVRVGNLPPGEAATVRLTLTGPIPCEDGEATFRFPLVVAPRYIPGSPLPRPAAGLGTALDTDAVPDASRITPPVLLPGQPNPVRLRLAVDVHPGGLPARDFRSSLHAVTESRDGGALHFAVQPGERVDRDFILRFRVADGAIRTGLAVQPDVNGADGGTFVLTLVPPQGSGAAEAPRDVVFVLDRSGSMGGWKMAAARNALARMIDTLTDRDRFTVFAFDDVVETPLGDDDLATATGRVREQVLAWLAQVDARNGTELARPLQRAVALLRQSADGGRDRVLVLLTDGQVGNEDDILRQLGESLKGLRIFTLGIDQAVNEGFLRRLAALGGGYTEVVESEERLDEVMDKVHNRIGTPVLTGVRLEPAGLRYEPQSLVPSRLPALFAGVPLVVAGRYQGSATGAIAVQARDDAGQLWSATLPVLAGASPAPAVVWARGRVRELEDRYARGGERRDLEQEIVATSLRYGVLCRFTAFVAADVKEVVNPGGVVERVVQPVELPAGWQRPEVEQYHLGGVASAAPTAALCSMRAYAAPAAMVDDDMDCMLGDFDEAEVTTRSATPRRASRAAAGGLLGKVVGKIANKLQRVRSPRVSLSAPPAEAAPVPATVPDVDLSAYRQRARKMADSLRSHLSGEAAVLFSELRRLLVRLEGLVDDLRSIGAPTAGALNDLHTGLRDVLQRPMPGADEVVAVARRVLEVLDAFADAAPEPAAAAAAAARAAFWK